MSKYGRLFIAAFWACTLLLTASVTYPSYHTEAGRQYSVARQRLSDLKKSSKKVKYRSYWTDCIRTFEMVEKRYPQSPHAADACFDRAGVYLDLYQFNKYSKDLQESIRAYEKCQAVYPKHEKAPEALYRLMGIYLDQKKDASSASKTCDKLAALYPDSPWTGKAKNRLGSNRAQKEAEIKSAPVPEISSLGTVTGIRHWSGGAYTRIVIDMDKPLKYQPQELKNPDRLFFDIWNARIGDSLKKDPLPIHDGILKQVRVNQHTTNIVRVVLDFASLKSYMAFPLHNPERLVVDITGEAGDAASAPSNTETGTQPNTGPRPEPPQAAKEDPDSGKNGKLSLSRQFGLKIKTIAIDAGHGGHDPGAIGRNGLKEKEITLDIARRLAALVKNKLGCNVIMTRDRDVYIGLEDRPAIAKTRGADLFISIHANANRKRRARGIETYIQGIQASDTDAMATAARENAMSTKKLSQLKSELERILKDLAGDDKSEESLQLAHAVQASLVGTMKPPQSRMMNVKRAFFYVLINTEMPSILAEVGFISNPDEEKLLRKESYRQKIAEALLQGVRKYVEARSPQTAGI